MSMATLRPWAGAGAPSSATPHQKTTPIPNKFQRRLYVICMNMKKMRDARANDLAAESRRDLWYVSERNSFRFEK